MDYSTILDSSALYLTFEERFWDDSKPRKYSQELDKGFRTATTMRERAPFFPSAVKSWSMTVPPHTWISAVICGLISEARQLFKLRIG